MSRADSLQSIYQTVPAGPQGRPDARRLQHAADQYDRGLAVTFEGAAQCAVPVLASGASVRRSTYFVLAPDGTVVNDDLGMFEDVQAAERALREMWPIWVANDPQAQR